MLTAGSKFPITTVRRTSSIFTASKLAGKGGYCGRPKAVSFGSIVVTNSAPLTPEIYE